jgi:hypothetical protein
VCVGDPSQPQRGTVIHVWTVNDAAYALRLWRDGVQGILSDDPQSILAARKSAGIQPLGTTLEGGSV